MKWILSCTVIILSLTLFIGLYFRTAFGGHYFRDLFPKIIFQDTLVMILRTPTQRDSRFGILTIAQRFQNSRQWSSVGRKEMVL